MSATHRTAAVPIPKSGPLIPVTGPRVGRYDSVAGSLGEHYRQALNDSNLLDLKEPIAALDAIVKRLLVRCEELDTPGLRKKAIDDARYVKSLLNGGDLENAKTAMARLITMLERGGDQDRVMRMLGINLDRLARRIEGAWQVKLGKRQSINTRDLLAIMGSFIEVVRSETTGVIAARILARIDREIMSNSGQSLLEEHGPARTVEGVSVVDVEPS